MGTHPSSSWLPKKFAVRSAKQVVADTKTPASLSTLKASLFLNRPQAYASNSGMESVRVATLAASCTAMQTRVSRPGPTASCNALPKIVHAATNAAQSDDGEKKKKKRRPRKTAEALVCLNCGDEGHASRECEQPKDESNSFSECFNCREIGHISSQCVMPCRKCGGDDHASHNCEER